jgi:signal transduction histidine kinase
LRGTAESLSDLPAAFKRVVEDNPQSREATFKAVVEGNVRELHPLVLEETYSIGREALINALRHSNGSHVEVEITYDPKLFRLRVRDNGHGVDPNILEDGGRPGHFGLQGMRERSERVGGQLKIWSGRETGTEIEFTVPGTTAYRPAGTKAGSSWWR